ncbi:MAG: hypothetical protein ABIK09_17420 [Pseudomonadota bacterium]
MERRRAQRRETPTYPDAGEVMSNRREFLGMVAKIMAGAAMLSPVVALASGPDDPAASQGQAPVVPTEPKEFPPLDGDVVAVEPARTRGVMKMPDPPVTGGVPKPPDPILLGTPPVPDPPVGDPPPVGCPPDDPQPTGGVVPMPDPPKLDGVMVPPEELK